MNDNDIIAHRLAAAGDHWRDAQPAPPAPNVARLTAEVRPADEEQLVGVGRPVGAGRPPSDGGRPGRRHDTRHGRRRLAGRSVILATVGVAAAVLVAVGVPQVLQRWSGGADTPSSPGPGKPPVPTGQTPAAQGEFSAQLFRDAKGAVYRCANISMIITFPPQLTCDQPRQRVEGVPESAFLYWYPDGTEFSSPASLAGATRGDGVFVAASVTLDLPRLKRSLGPPCGVPAPDPTAAELAALRVRQAKVAELVSARPDRYGASWVASDDATVTVGTTGDVSAAQTLFEGVYPKQFLCVYRAEYSYTQLAGYASRFAAGGYYAGIDPVHNRVNTVGRSAAEQRLIEQIEPGAFTTN